MSTPAPYDGSNAQPPQGYGYPPPDFSGQPHGYGRRPARNGLAITSLVLGILGLATCWLTFPGIILGILAVIFGGIGIARGRADRVSNKGMAIAGLITGIIAVIIGSVLLVLAIQISNNCHQQFGSDITPQELQQCVQDQVN
ncbi:MAG: DUF4190 domain-containing protein [Geodermatophilaceae bacterium]|nr:DUF4190 domain-containing protein [Geodermatophilaceae bacterium]